MSDLGRTRKEENLKKYLEIVLNKHRKKMGKNKLDLKESHIRILEIYIKGMLISIPFIIILLIIIL